jgi:SAM-dependent methyltransferase
MTVTTTAPSVTELIGSFIHAAPERRGAHFQVLVGALWENGRPAAVLDQSADSAVPALVELLDDVDDEVKGHVAILLGLLAEAAYPGTCPAVREGLDVYLDLLSRTPEDEPLSLALRYLVSHFPEDREVILSVVEPLDLPADDLSRLERALRPLNTADPDLGRVFPSPAVWTLDENERDFDRSWIQALSPEQVVKNWQDDTRTVFGSTGAKAYWAVRNGRPAPTAIPELPSDDRIPRPAEPTTDLFGAHAAAFRCPGCGGSLEFAPAPPRTARCTGCAATYPITNGILNLTAAAAAGPESDLQFKLAEMPSMGLFYEAHARPHFLRVSGANWGDQISPEDEDAYIADHVRPVAGSVLDMAAGAGRWTDVLARTVGPERVIALDLNPPMLSMLRARLPEVPAVLSSAAPLPFADESLGAAMCWNALQAFPAHAAAAIAEVGRCLRPGGTFTVLTFRMSDDPVYRYFQSCHRLPQHTDGLRLFELDQLHGWFAAAGLQVQEQSTPGTFVFLTAVKP